MNYFIKEENRLLIQIGKKISFPFENPEKKTESTS